MRSFTRLALCCALAALVVSMTARQTSAAITVNGLIDDLGSTGVFTNDTWTNDLDGSNTLINRIQWAPSCGNDFVYVDNVGIKMPEPATLLMGLLGAVGVAGLRRFRREEA